MTQAQTTRLIGFNASLKSRGVSVSVQPSDISVLALVEEITEKTRQRLQVQDDICTQLIHIKRTDLIDAQGEPIELPSLTVIERGDSEQTYRIQHYTDDPQKPQVHFFCTLK